MVRVMPELSSMPRLVADETRLFLHLGGVFADDLPDAVQGDGLVGGESQSFAEQEAQ